jgi:hypothetical protein
MADADIFNLHRILLPQKPLTKTRTLGPKNHPRSPVLWLTLTSSAKINYLWESNRCWKLSPWCPKIHPRNPILSLMMKSSIYTDYYWLRNRWRKLGPSDPNNHPRSPVLRLTLTSSTQINYSWQTNRWWKLSPCCPKNHPRTQFYGWRWNLHCTQTNAGSEIVDEN